MRCAWIPVFWPPPVDFGWESRMTQDPNRKTSDRETQKAALKVRPRKKKWDRHEGWKREGHVMQNLKRFRVAFPPESLDTLTDQDTWADISGLLI